ncbi:MAG: STAS domain-containing protein [Ilumatobacteraceae bacterium]
MSDRIASYCTRRARTPVGWTPPADTTCAGLRFFSTQIGSTACVEISGQLDIATEATLRSHLGAQIDRGARDLLLDMSLIRFCDAAMVRVLVATHARLRGVRGRVQVVDQSDCVAHVLELTNLGHFLQTPTL